LQQIGTANDLGDVLLIIIHHDSQLISDDIIFSFDNEVADFPGQILLCPTLQFVVESQGLVGCFNTQGVFCIRAYGFVFA